MDMNVSMDANALIGSMKVIERVLQEAKDCIPVDMSVSSHNAIKRLDTAYNTAKMVRHTAELKIGKQIEEARALVLREEEEHGLRVAV